jgi:hypothetical protein
VVAGPAERMGERAQQLGVGTRLFPAARHVRRGLDGGTRQDTRRSARTTALRRRWRPVVARVRRWRPAAARVRMWRPAAAERSMAAVCVCEMEKGENLAQEIRLARGGPQPPLFNRLPHATEIGSDGGKGWAPAKT